jgi:hypothetical protein
MEPQRNNPPSISTVIHDMGESLRQQARQRWKGVRTAQRKERGRHVWRFRSGSDSQERFLHVPRESMTNGQNPAASLLNQLEDAHWLDQLQDGPERSYLLSPAGNLKPWPRP